MGVQQSTNDGGLIAFNGTNGRYERAAAPVAIPVATSAPSDSAVPSGHVIFYISGSDLLVKYNNGSSVVGGTVASSLS